MPDMHKRGQKSGLELRKKETMLVTALNEELRRSRTAPRIAQWLACPINRWELPYDARRLARIVLRLQKLAVEPPRREYHLEAYPPDDSPAGHNARQLHRLMREYQAFPYIAPEPNGVWELVWEGPMSRQIPALLVAVELAKMGKIHSLRQCRIDEKWFFARTAESKFCSTKCRETFHQNDPERKAKRREWAKANYQSRKELELGSKKAAKRRGGKR